jgi:hypothetical protein
MANVDPPPIIEPDRQLARRIGLALVGLVLAGCCFWSGLGAWLFAPLTPFLANRLIYNREGQLVAEAAKTGWTPRMLGWAHDSSGVYFQMLIQSGAASMLVPYEPIFKLSPLTPEEEQSALIWRIGMWAIGVGALGGVG